MPGIAFFGYEMGDHRWKVWMDGNAQKAAPRSVIDSHIPKPRLAEALH
jgi:hypothetical protein